MAIKTDAQRKARTIEGKPVGEWFDSAAQRQKRDNKYASYDSPMRRPLPEAEKETKAEPKGAEKTESAYDKGKAMGIAAIEQARNSRFSRRFPARPSEKPGTGSTIASLLAKPSAHAKGKEMGKAAIADARNEGIKASRKRSRGSSFPARPAESKRPSDSYVSKPGYKSILDMPSGNKDVEAAKEQRVAAAKAKDEAAKRMWL